MRNLLTLPSRQSDDRIVDAADWVETSTLFRADGNISQEDLARALVRSSERTRRLSPGVDERAREIAIAAFEELRSRADACAPSTNAVTEYPFRLDRSGTSLQVLHRPRLSSNRGVLYWYLLLITRADMQSDSRILSGIDPTGIFERLCADVLRNFWGGQSQFAGAIVFGTSASGSMTFKEKVNDLCRKLADGAGWRVGARPPRGGDGKLDVVAWRRFADNRSGALIGFGQCKTGLHWREHLTKLRPLTFSRKFMQQPLVIEPVRLFMVPVRVDALRWSEDVDEAGILLDLCRIVQYGYGIADVTLRQCKRWIDAAVARQRTGRITV